MVAHRDWLSPGGKKTPYWQLRLPAPKAAQRIGKWKTRYLSTGKTTYDEAEIWALPYILEHKQNLLDYRDFTAKAKLPRGAAPHKMSLALHTIPRLQPNEIEWEETTNDDGVTERFKLQCSIDGKTIAIFDVKGNYEGSCQNEIDVEVHTGNTALDREIREIKERLSINEKARPDFDQEVFDLWAASRKPAIVKDGKRALQRLHAAAPTRTFLTLTETDVRAFVAAMVAEKAATASIKRQVSHLSNMVAEALAHNDQFPYLEKNPFILPKLVPTGLKGRRTEGRLFSDTDLALIAADLKNWRADERLLWTMLRTMGCRLSEPFQIKGEETYKGFRCVDYGTKTNNGQQTDTSRRVMTLPTAVQRLIPDPIPVGESPFPFGKDNTAGRMYDRLEALGFPPNCGKTAQSLRAAVETDLGNLDVSQRIIDAIMGHATDDLNGNEAGNQAVRAMGPIQRRYFRGNHPSKIFNALELIQSGI